MAAEDAKQMEPLDQATLPNLPLNQMSPAERAELKRRYDNFVRNFGAAGAASAAPPKAKPRPVKWVPGSKPAGR